MIFETHAHYDDDRFKDDRDETIKRVHEKGVAPIINVGASIGSTMTTIELAKKYQIPILKSAESTSSFSAEVIRWLKVQLAPCIVIHGVLVDVYGEGVLIWWS